MKTVKLKGFDCDFHVYVQNGVFYTLHVMTWQSVNGELFYLPTPSLGFKEWEGLGGSLSRDAAVYYVYGKIKCHKSQLA